MGPPQLPKIMINWKPEGRKKRVRLRRTWRDGIYTAMSERDLRMGEWNNRRQWNMEVGRCRQTFQNRTHTRAHTYIHTHTHTHIYIYTHIITCASSRTYFSAYCCGTLTDYIFLSFCYGHVIHIFIVSNSYDKTLHFNNLDTNHNRTALLL
jgi:hypothetical protein